MCFCVSALPACTAAKPFRWSGQSLDAAVSGAQAPGAVLEAAYGGVTYGLLLWGWQEAGSGSSHSPQLISARLQLSHVPEGRLWGCAMKMVPLWAFMGEGTDLLRGHGATLTFCLVSLEEPSCMKPLRHLLLPYVLHL